MSLYEPVTKNLKLDMRMNLKSKKVSPIASAEMIMSSFDPTRGSMLIMEGLIIGPQSTILFPFSPA